MAYILWKFFFKRYTKVRRSVIYSSPDKYTETLDAGSSSSALAKTSLEDDDALSREESLVKSRNGDRSSNTAATYKNKSRGGGGATSPNKNIREVHSRPPEKSIADNQKKNVNKEESLHPTKHSPCYEKNKKSHRTSRRHAKKKEFVGPKHSPVFHRHAESIELSLQHKEAITNSSNNNNDNNVRLSSSKYETSVDDVRKSHPCLVPSKSAPPQLTNETVSAKLPLPSPNNDTESVLSLYWMKDIGRSKSNLGLTSSVSLHSLNKKPSDVDIHVENSFSSLYTPFDHYSGELVRQARDILVCNYQGNIKKFHQDFLIPAASLVADFKQAERTSAHATKFLREDGWPLCSNRRILIHLGEADSTLLKNGDFYLCIRKRTTHAAAGVQLVLKYRCSSYQHSRIQERVIPSAAFGNIFTMDWLHSLQLDSASDEQLSSLLQHMLVAVEKGIDRIRWEAVSRPRTCNHAAQTDEQNDEKKKNDACVSTSSSPATTCSVCGKKDANLSRDEDDTTVDESDKQCVKCCNNIKQHVDDTSSKNQSETPINFTGMLPELETKDCSVQTSPMEECKTFGSTSQEEYLNSQTDKDILTSTTVDSSQTSSPLINSNLNSNQHINAVSDCGQFKSAIPKKTTSPKANSEEQDDGYHDNCISTPTGISEIDPPLLQSKAALMPGSRDNFGRALVVLDCKILQTLPQPNGNQLAQLCLYYQSILRREVSSKGLFVLVDVGEETDSETLQLLDEVFCLLEAHTPGIIQTLVLWTTGPEDAFKEDKNIFPQSSIQYQLVTSADNLHKMIKKENLLPQYGGSYHFDLEEWQEFRQTFEPFVHECRSSGKRLVSVMQGLKGSRLPPTSTLTSQIIDEHKQHVVHTFEDAQLKRLQHEGKETLNDLQLRQQKFPHNVDFRECVERSQALYNELQRAVMKLARLSEKRLFKLEQALQLRTFEEDTGQVLTWLCKKGEETLDKHKDIADNLAAVRTQERDFEKFYFVAMRNIEKGQDLLEEATTLSQSGLQEASGMQDLSHSLKSHLRGFTERLEDTRERLEDTSRCYQFLDKAYEWALEAMKFVSRMKMEQNVSATQLTQLTKALQSYLLSHPPISEDVFHEMIVVATKLNNERLIEQCKIAQARCQETTDLIRTRQSTLLKARQQMGAESLRSSHSDLTEIIDPLSLTSSSSLLSSPLTTSTSSWSVAPVTSTPQPYTRRRSIGCLPTCTYSTPGYVSQGYSAFFRENYHLDTYISEHEENFVDEVISDYASPPLSSGASSSSSQQTEDPGEVCNKSTESSLTAECETLNTAIATSTTHHLPAAHSKPPKKYMRRSQTWQYEMDPWQKVASEERCNLDTDYTKGSTESIQTVVENEDPSSLELTPDNSGHNSYPPSSVNSHLHHQNDEEMSSDLNEDQMKHKRTLTLIMREMVQTERDYVKSLEYTIENYIPQLLREDIPQALRGKRNVVFGNIEKIYEFHSQYFLHELEKCERSPFLVGQCFLRFERQFYLYALYNKNKPKSDELMLEYGTSFFKCKQLQLKDKMDLASYLLKPVQRMGKYALLIKQLLKECPEKEAEHIDLKSAEDMVKFQLRHGNDLLAMDCIRETDVDLKEQGRLIRQDEFLVWQGKGRKCLRRHVFLFEELIVFTKARRDPERKSRDIYQYKNCIKMSDIGLTEQVGESSAKFEIWFRKCKLNDTYILQAANANVRNSWVQDISKLLWKQALRNRELRLAEMSSMGIGNKPCLDIKPSQDQINDRSISINQLTKAPRFRNSIAVIATDQTRNTNKRPHSIISVSSSSSGSSQASTSQYGALNLGFDPSDSPKTHHRSITQQSQCSAESGIIPDISVGFDYLNELDSNKKLERTSSNASTDSMSTNNSSPVIEQASTGDINTENR